MPKIGHRGHRGAVPYGYQIVEGVWSPEPGSARIIQSIFSESAKGVKPSEIARALNRQGIPSPEGDPLPERLGVAGRLFQHAYYFDEIIANLVRGPVTRGAEWLNRGFDLGIIDGAVNGVATLVRDAGGRLRRVQTGLVRNYALGVVLGAVALLVFLAVRAG